MIIAKCRVNKSNGQKTLTVPKEAAIYKGDQVLLTKLVDPTQMNNEKEVTKDGTSTDNSRGSGYDSSPGTSRDY